MALLFSGHFVLDFVSDVLFPAHGIAWHTFFQRLSDTELAVENDIRLDDNALLVSGRW